VIPVLLDERPSYLGAGDVPASALLLPMGAGTLLGELLERVGEVTSRAPIVVPDFAAGPRYLEALRRSEHGAGAVAGPEIFRDPLARFDPSDALLLVSAACYPVDGVDLGRFVASQAREPRMLRHLLAFESGQLGAQEFVQAGADGRIRRVQRYFEQATWPFPAGVIASIVPVSCLLMAAGEPAQRLPALRAALAAQGLPSQDAAYHGRFVDLTDEAGALALMEQRLLRVVDEAAAARPRGDAGPLLLSETVSIHPSARFVGPVVVAGGACVDVDALVVGPALIGRNAHVSRGVTLAQCVVTDGARVGPGVTQRHRVITADTSTGFTPGAVLAVPQRRQSYGGAEAPPPPLHRGRYLAVKAAVEPLLALAVLVALSPLFLVLAALIVVDSGLPVFYGHRREGLGGVPFRCWKFRSMRTDADDMQRALASAQQLDGPQFKMDRDPRVTRVGRWLRRLNVDELPQLWNVVRGQMSFVGPRPSPFRENQICIPWRHGRLSVRPGITGLWQVCRRDRASGDFHQWIHYDLLYVRHVSLRVDLRIFAATLITLGGKRPTALERILPDARGHTPLGAARATPPAGAPPVGDAPGPESPAAPRGRPTPPRGGRVRGAWPPRSARGRGRH
jgi:lipopolysaccharide/colanic/teichoic acid biosynthesis glycosyltransferase